MIRETVKLTCNHCGCDFRTKYYSNGSIAHSNITFNLGCYISQFNSGDKEESFINVLGLYDHFESLQDILIETVIRNFNCCLSILGDCEFSIYLKSREHEIVDYFNKEKDYMINKLNNDIDDIKNRIKLTESKKANPIN
jgi:hypothetical protein